jgi:ankyrin repeat protein
VRLLLDLGASVDLAPAGMTALWYAAGGLGWNYRPGGDGERVGTLLGAGADATATRPPRSSRGGAGVSALARAAATGDAERVRLLLERGADPAPEGALAPIEVPLDAAVESGSVEVVRLLLAAGVPVDPPRDPNDDPVLGSASSLAMLRVLLDAGADPLGQCSFGKSIAEMVARNGKAAIDERVAMLNVLVSNGVDLDARTPRTTAMFGPAMNGDFEAVQVLLAAGADPRVEPRAMAAACFLGFDDRHERIEATIAVLIEAGIDPNETDEHGYRPLHAALAPDTYGPGYQESDGFSLPAAIALIEHGASIDIEYPDTGYRPLHAAAAAGSDALVEELLRLGADPTVLTMDGESPTDIARNLLVVLRSRPPSLDRAREIRSTEQGAKRLYDQWKRTREIEVARTERCVAILTAN